MEDIWASGLFLLWWLSVPAYVVVQIIVLLRASGISRWVAALPLLFMVPMYVLFVIGLFVGGDNNLAWLLLILPSPVALLYVVVVGLFVFFARPTAKHSPPAT
jgi:hypothetical protein